MVITVLVAAGIPCQYISVTVGHSDPGLLFILSVVCRYSQRATRDHQQALKVLVYHIGVRKRFLKFVVK